MPDRALVKLKPRFPAKSRLLRWFQESAIFISSSESRKQLQRSIVNPRPGLGAAGLGTVLLLVWNANLVISTGAGMGTMVLLYLLQDDQWRQEKLPQLQDQLQRQLEGLNRPLIWSVLGGSGAAFLTYLSIAAWSETDSHWLVTGILIQGLLTFGVLGLGLRQMGLQKAASAQVETIEFSHWVEKLTAEDPIVRLLAVRQLTTIVQSSSLEQQKELLEYFQLMVSQEPEALIREAVWQALEALTPNLNLLKTMSVEKMSVEKIDEDLTEKELEKLSIEAEVSNTKMKAWVEPNDRSIDRI